MTGIVAAITGASIRGIVGRRAEVQKLETVGVMVRVEKIGEVACRAVCICRCGRAEHEQTVEPCGEHRCRDWDAQRHARGLGSVEIDHPLHPVVNGNCFRAHAGGWRLGIGSHCQRAHDRAAPHRDCRLAARRNDRNPAVGHEPREWCAPPGSMLSVVDHGYWREGRRHR